MADLKYIGKNILNHDLILKKGHVSGSAASTGSFGRLEASVIGGNSPIRIESDDFIVATDGSVSGSSTSTGSFGDVMVANNLALGGDPIYNTGTTGANLTITANNPYINLNDSNSTSGTRVYSIGSDNNLLKFAKMTDDGGTKVEQFLMNGDGNFSMGTGGGTLIEHTNSSGGNLTLDGNNPALNLYDNNAISGQRNKSILSMGGALYIGKTADDGTSAVNHIVVDNSGNVEVPVGNISGSVTTTGSLGSITAAGTGVSSIAGNLGIGTTSPNISNVSGRAMTLNSPAGGYAIFEFAENGARQGNINHFGDTMKMYNNQNGGLELGTNNSIRLSIAAGGDVSLTHDLSAANLSVAGNITHTDNATTKIAFDTNEVQMFSNNNERLTVADGVVNVIAMLSGSGEVEFRKNLLVDQNITGSGNLQIDGDIKVGKYSDTTHDLWIKTAGGGSGTGAIKFRTSTDNYGFSIVNEEAGSSDRGLRFKRHENDATGVDVLKLRRDNGTIEFPIANQMISGSSSSTGSFGNLRVVGMSVPDVTVFSSSLSTRITNDSSSISTRITNDSSSFSARITADSSSFSIRDTLSEATSSKILNGQLEFTNITGSGHFSSSLSSTASFGRVEATTIGGHSPLGIDSITTFNEPTNFENYISMSDAGTLDLQGKVLINTGSILGDLHITTNENLMRFGKATSGFTMSGSDTVSRFATADDGSQIDLGFTITDDDGDEVVSGDGDGIHVDSDNYWYNNTFYKVGDGGVNRLQYDGKGMQYYGKLYAQTGSIDGELHIQSPTGSMFIGKYTGGFNVTGIGAASRFATGSDGSIIDLGFTIKDDDGATQVVSTGDGLFVDDSNYWYTTGNFRVGNANNFVKWDLINLTISGAFSGDGSGLTGIGAASIPTDTVSGSAQLASNISGSFTQLSASLSNRIATGGITLPTNTVSSSAQLSVDISGSFIELSASLASRITAEEVEVGSVPANTVSSSVQLASSISGSFVQPSSSFSTRVTSLEVGGVTIPANTVSSSVQLASSISGSFVQPSSSFSTRVTTLETTLTSEQTNIDNLQTDSGSFSTRVASLEVGGVTVPANTVSSSVQLASSISGSFVQPSASFSTRTTTLETTMVSEQTNIDNLQTDSGSFSTRLTTEEGNVDTLQARDLIAGAGLTGGGTLASDRTFAVGAGTGVTVNANDVAIGQAVATSDNVTFGSVTTSGNISGSLTSTGSFGNIQTPLEGRVISNFTEMIKVTVVDDGGNHYAFEGATTPSIQVSEGKTYRFDTSDSSNDGHPFRFSTTQHGSHNGGSAYTTGVTVVGTAGDPGSYTEIQITKSTSNFLYYYCTAHNGMGNDGRLLKNDLMNLKAIKVTGNEVDFTNLPTSDPTVAGRLWNDSGTVKVSSG